MYTKAEGTRHHAGARLSIAVALLAVALITVLAQQRAAYATGCTFSLSNAAYSVAEGGQVPIVVNKAGSCTDPTSVTLIFTNGTAAGGVQYLNPSPVFLPFTNADTSKSWPLQTLDDAVTGNTTLTATISLTNPSGDVLGTTVATITIIDNDAVNYSFGSTVYSVNEAAGFLSGTVVRGGSTAAGASVQFSTVNGTATAGSDFTGVVAGTATFAIGSSTAPFNVAITNDGVSEGSEQFTLHLVGSSPVGTLGPDATVTIIDDDGAGTLQFTSATFFANEGQGVALLTVSRTGGSTGPVSVLCSTTGGTATAGLDYTAVVSQSLNWGIGDVADKSCQVPIIQDVAIEGAETVTAQLFGVAGATLGGQFTTTLTINDDDGTGGLQFQSATYTANENGGAALLTLVRTGGTVGQVTVDCTTTVGGTATAGVDYTAGSFTATFVNGASTATCSIPITDDLLVEGSETVLVSLTNPTGGANVTGVSTATLTILDNESAGPIISFLTPVVGPTIGGTTVSISGSNFTNASSVTFGGTAATFFVNSSTLITATAPAHFAGAVEVLVTTPVGTNTTIGAQNDYTYTDGPTITSVTPSTGPASGSPATFVTITGTGFVIGGTGMTVSFGGTATTSFTVSDTGTLVVIAPAHTAGLVDIRITTPGGTTPITVADQFTYTGTTAPVVTGVSPSSGPVGTIVTIIGSGFTGVTCPSGITFGGVVADSASCTVNSDSSITAKVPVNAPAGTIDVIITGPGGTSANTGFDNFVNTSSASTLTYTLAFRFTLIGWSGIDNISAAAALKGLETPDNPATNNVFNIVTVIWQFDTVTQSYKGYFPGSEGVPGANDFTTLRKGVGYFIAVNSSTTWTVIEG